MDRDSPHAHRRTEDIFAGRQEELELLSEALDQASAGHGRTAMLVGEPGIGKTRLAEELAVGAEDAGFLVLPGRCYESGGAPS